MGNLVGIILFMLKIYNFILHNINSRGHHITHIKGFLSHQKNGGQARKKISFCNDF